MSGFNGCHVCEKKGHFCLAKAKDAAGLPICFDCDEGQPCFYERNNRDSVQPVMAGDRAQGWGDAVSIPVVPLAPEAIKRLEEQERLEKQRLEAAKITRKSPLQPTGMVRWDRDLKRMVATSPAEVERIQRAMPTKAAAPRAELQQAPAEPTGGNSIETLKELAKMPEKSYYTPSPRKTCATCGKNVGNRAQPGAVCKSCKSAQSKPKTAAIERMQVPQVKAVNIKPIHAYPPAIEQRQSQLPPLNASLQIVADHLRAEIKQLEEVLHLLEKRMVHP